MLHTSATPNTRLALSRFFLVKSGEGSGKKIANQAGFYLLNGRWHKITPAKPAPKGSPVAMHPKAAGHHEPVAHFTPGEWAALKLPDSNVNAPGYNKGLDKLQALSDAGDVTGIVGSSFGTNTYGKKLAVVANHLLGLHGSQHKVVAGQKAGEHAGVQGDAAPAPHPSGLPGHLVPASSKPSSVATDSSGKPIVFYHGGVNIHASALAPLTYFTTDKSVAEDYLENGTQGGAGVVHAVHLSIKNPANDTDVDAAAKKVGIWNEYENAHQYLTESVYGGAALAVAAELRKQGFDGAKLIDMSMSGGAPITSWVMFDKGQAKLVDSPEQVADQLLDDAKASAKIPPKFQAVMDAWAASGDFAALSSTAANNAVSNPAIAKYAQKLVNKKQITVPVQLGKTGSTTFPEPPDFADHDAVLAWVAKRAKALGTSKQVFSSSYEYAYAMPKMQAAYDVEKSAYNKKQADHGAEVLEQMKSAGVKVGDTVAWTQTGAFLSQTKFEGKVVLKNSVPHVKLAHEVAVSSPGGKISYTKLLPWQPHMKVKGAAVASAPTNPMDTWLALTSKHWGDIQELGEVTPFLKDPVLAGPAALHAFTAGAFSEINADPDNAASKALLGYIDKLPVAADKKIHRVLGFEDTAAAAAFVADLAPGGNPSTQQRTLSSWTASDPTANGQTPMNNIALDLSSSFGDHRVFLSIDGQKTGKDISFAYSKAGTANPGGEIVLSKGTKLDVVSISHKGDDTHVVVREVQEGDTKPGADGGTLVLKNGRWHKSVDADEHGELPPVLVPVSDGLAMPDFQEGKTTTGVKAYYEKVAEKVMGLAGDAAALGAMKDAGSKPNAKGKVTSTWAGKTANSKALLALHAAALGGDEPAPAPAVQSDDGGAPPTPVLKLNVIPWDSFLLPASNVNAASVNKKLGAIKAAALAGDVAALESMKFGVNSYNKKLAKVAANVVAVLKDDGGDVALAPEPVQPPAPAVLPTPAAPPAPAQQPVATFDAKLAQIPWDKLLLPSSNSNAPGHNKAVGKIKAMAEAGDQAGLQAFVDGKAGAKQNYAKKQALLAQTALAALAESGPAAAPVPVQAPVPAAQTSKPHTPIGLTSFIYVADEVAGYIASGDKVGLAGVVEHMAPMVSKSARKVKDYAAAGLAYLNGSSAQASGSPQAVSDLVAIGQQKAQAKANAIKAVEAAGYGVQDVPSKGLLFSNYKGGMAQAYHGQTAASKAAQKLFENGIDAEVIGSHPYFVKIHGAVLGGAAAAPVVNPVPVPTTEKTIIKKDALFFENTDDGHNKFWSVSVNGSVMKTTWGKNGTSGQTSEKSFSSPQAAADAASKLTKEKKAKGYGYVGQSSHDYEVSAPAVEVGPKDGDTKPGADGMLVFKDGHWHKVAAADDRGWTYDESNPGLGGAKSLEFSAGGYEYYIADNGEGGWEFGVSLQEDPSEPDGFTMPSLSALVLELKAEGYPVPPTSALQKLDPAYKPAVQVVKKLTMAEISAAIKTVTPSQEKFSMNKPGSAAKKAAMAGDVSGMKAAHLAAQNMGYEKTAAHIVAVGKAMGVTIGGLVLNPVHAATSVPAYVEPVGHTAIDAWAQTGPQGGSNPGGRFKDESGVEWYCKFPASEEVARSEVLAAQLYSLAGVAGQDAKLITRSGKIGIASRWVDVSKAGSPAKLAATDGVLSGFVVDAWLGNWDVVGLGYDNLQVGADGQAIRVDAGGSLEYRAMGAKKPFGAKVSEIDTLRDKMVNPQAAAVFGKITEADMTASAVKVAAVSESAIRQLVAKVGPGTMAEKKALADTLIARRADILARFPKAAAKAKMAKFKVENISAPPNFSNWGDGGKGLSSVEAINDGNNAAAKAAYESAINGNLEALQSATAPIYDKATHQVTGHVLLSQHPSQHVRAYWADLVNEVDLQLNPPQAPEIGTVVMDEDAAVISAKLKPVPSGGAVAAIEKSKKIGDYIVLGQYVGALGVVNPGKDNTVISSDEWKAKTAAHYHAAPGAAKQTFGTYVSTSGARALNTALRNGNLTNHVSGKSVQQHLDDFKDLLVDIPPGSSFVRRMGMKGYGSSPNEKKVKELQQFLLSAGVGTVVQEPGFSSTSWSGGNAILGNNDIEWQFTAGAGVKMYPGWLTANKGEGEGLLPPNQRYMIVGATKVGKTVRVQAVLLPTI
jgi:predicted DNA-binding WGR domain protein